MVHTYEVLVDIREYAESTSNACRSGTERYEIDAESRKLANDLARAHARSDHPLAVECEARVTRLLR
jgi:hypothetical protein